jgi:hypothetical protein
MTGAIPNNKIAEALRKTHGNFMLAARMLGCSRQTIWLRVQKSEDLQKVVEDERAGFVDVAEGALYAAVLNNEPWAVQFALKNLGKERGYVEKQQHELAGKDGKPIEHRYILVDGVKRDSKRPDNN